MMDVSTDSLSSGLYRRHRNFTDSVQNNSEVAGFTAGWESLAQTNSPDPENHIVNLNLI
jgi:hypothetical protein